jgi:hypothetical protein
MAAAVVLGAWVPADLAAMLDDSKKLTAEQRLAAFLALRASAAEIGVGAASVAEILRLNILHASMLAMRRAVGRLAAAPDLALVDGNYPPKLGCPVRCVVGGDGLCRRSPRLRSSPRWCAIGQWPGWLRGFQDTGGKPTRATRPRYIARRWPAWGRPTITAKRSELLHNCGWN